MTRLAILRPHFVKSAFQKTQQTTGNNSCQNSPQIGAILAGVERTEFLGTRRPAR